MSFSHQLSSKSRPQSINLCDSGICFNKYMPLQSNQVKSTHELASHFKNRC